MVPLSLIAAILRMYMHHKSGSNHIHAHILLRKRNWQRASLGIPVYASSHFYISLILFFGRLMGQLCPIYLKHSIEQSSQLSGFVLQRFFSQLGIFVYAEYLGKLR